MELWVLGGTPTVCVSHTATWALGVHNITCVTYSVNDTLSIQAALVAGFTCVASCMLT